MSRSLTRREFLKRSALGATAMTLAPVGLSAAARLPGPNDKIRIACVGTTNQAGWNIENLAGEEITALCDVDSEFLERAGARYPHARRYKDYREMFDKEQGKIDAALVATADHTHAPAAAMALRLGKHVYCEKPLTHTIAEARLLARLADEKKLATQMGTQIHAGENYRVAVEIVQSGVLGAIKEVHVWVGGGNWSNGKFVAGTPAPARLDWDLWLGTAPERPYSPNIHPANWRSFWDYGGGQLTDLGCHRIDLPHWALDLRYPTSCRAEGPPVDPTGAPPWLIATWEYPARGKQPPLTLTWYHGGKRPARLAGYKNADGSPVQFGDGVLFVGTEGDLYADYGHCIMLPVDKFTGYKPPAPTIPRSIGHHAEWLRACRTGEPTTCNFDYSGALTEAVLLGIVAYRTGEKLIWDGPAMKAINSTAAAAFVTKEYRRGWELEGVS